jgi:hypothetical protein
MACFVEGKNKISPDLREQHPKGGMKFIEIKM